MQDDKLLARLYALQSASDKDALIQEMIDEAKIDIVKESRHSVGLGNPADIWRKWFRSMRKKDMLRGRLLVAKGILNWVYLGEKHIVKVKGHEGLPVGTAYRAEANAALDLIESEVKRCKEQIILPDRAELDAEKKVRKAYKLPKVIEVWDGGPVVDIDTLMDIEALFCRNLTAIAYIDPARGKNSPVVFRRGAMKGLIYPEK